MWTFLQILLIFTVIAVVIWLAYGFLIYMLLVAFDRSVWAIDKITALLKGEK